MVSLKRRRKKVLPTITQVMDGIQEQKKNMNERNKELQRKGELMT